MCLVCSCQGAAPIAGDPAVWLRRIRPADGSDDECVFATVGFIIAHLFAECNTSAGKYANEFSHRGLTKGDGLCYTPGGRGGCRQADRDRADRIGRSGIGIRPIGIGIQPIRDKDKADRDRDTAYQDRDKAYQDRDKPDRGQG